MRINYSPFRYLSMTLSAIPIVGRALLTSIFSGTFLLAPAYKLWNKDFDLIAPSVFILLWFSTLLRILQTSPHRTYPVGNHPSLIFQNPPNIFAPTRYLNWPGILAFPMSLYLYTLSLLFQNHPPLPHLLSMYVKLSYPLRGDLSATPFSWKFPYCWDKWMLPHLDSDYPVLWFVLCVA
jgi:hypothetical protein